LYNHVKKKNQWKLLIQHEKTLLGKTKPRKTKKEKKILKFGIVLLCIKFFYDDCKDSYPLKQKKGTDFLVTRFCPKTKVGNNNCTNMCKKS
jgi:hypothetical protein